MFDFILTLKLLKLLYIHTWNKQGSKREKEKRDRRCGSFQIRLSTGGRRREDLIQAAEADLRSFMRFVRRVDLFWKVLVFPSSSTHCRVVSGWSDNWVSVERLVAAGYKNTASISSLCIWNHIRPPSTFIDPDTTPQEEQKCQRRREDALSSFDESDRQTSRCPAAFMTPVFTGLQAGCQMRTNTETY